MGSCCGKPQVENQEATSAAVLAQQLLPSLSFIQGVKIRPSIAALGNEDGHSTCVQQEGSCFFACLFNNVLPGSSWGSRMAAGKAWTSLQQAMVKHPHNPEEAMQAMFTTIHTELVAHNKLAARNKDTTTNKVQPAWVVGVAVLGDVQQRTLRVASVGCCHAAACHVAGSFAHATATGLELTEIEQLRPILQALVQQPDNSDVQRAAAGQVLGLSAPPLVVEASLHGATTGQRPQLSEPGAGTAALRTGSPAVPVSATSSPGRGNTQLLAADAQGQRRNTTAGRMQHGAGSPVPIICQMSTHQLTAPCRHLFLMSDSLASSFSAPDLACLAHHFQPAHVQMLRNAAAACPVQLEPLPKKHGKGKLAAQPSSPRQAKPGSKMDSTPAGKTTPRASASRLASPAQGAAGSTATRNNANTSPSMSTAADASAAASPTVSRQVAAAGPKEATGPDGITLKIGGVELWQLPPPVKAPGFNLASLVLHHAKARQTLLRQRQARVHKAQGKGTGASKSAWPHQLAAPPTQLGVSSSTDSGLLSGAAAGADVALLVLSFEWPLSVTSQQVALAASVAASRAARPNAQYRWHMIRQLVRHMRARKRRLLSLWYDMLSRQQAVLKQDRRAAEVLAWKHLGEAVQMVVGGGVVRVDSTPGASPANPSPSPTPNGPSPSLTPRKSQRGVTLNPAAQAHAAALPALVVSGAQASSRPYSKSPKAHRTQELQENSNHAQGSVSIGGSVTAAGSLGTHGSLGMHEPTEMPTPTLLASQQQAGSKPWGAATGGVKQSNVKSALPVGGSAGTSRTAGTRNAQHGASLRSGSKPAGAAQVTDDTTVDVMDVMGSCGGDDTISKVAEKVADGFAVVSSPVNSPNKKGTAARNNTSRSAGGAPPAQDVVHAAAKPGSVGGTAPAVKAGPIAAVSNPTKWQLDQERPCRPTAGKAAPDACVHEDVIKMQEAEVQPTKADAVKSVSSAPAATAHLASQKVLSPPSSTGSGSGSGAAVRGKKRATAGHAYSLRGSKLVPGK